MLRYITAKTTDGHAYIGMMAIVDTRLQLATWMALPVTSKPSAPVSAFEQLTPVVR